MNRIYKFQKNILIAVLLILWNIAPTDSHGQTSKRKVKNASYSYHSNRDNDGNTKIRYKSKTSNFELEFNGDIKISNDDKDILSISRGGFIEIRKSSFGNRRRILIEANNAGQLTKSFYVGRSEKNYNTEGKTWLAEILPEVVRTTTIGAESRVDRFYLKGGANSVLTEIGNLKSDYVKSTYFKLLIRKKLTNSELVSVIKKAGSEIRSDHYLSGILQENQKAFLANDKTIAAYVQAAKSIQSDHYATNVLKKLINDSSINDNQMGALLEISKDIKSDHYMTNVLKEIMDKRTLNEKNTLAIINLSKDIQSDHYKTVVLKKVIDKKDLPINAYTAYMATLSDVRSDHYTTEVIKKLLDTKLDTKTSSLIALLTLVDENIQSDHYTMTIFKKLAKQRLSEDQLIATLKAASTIRSDHYLSQVLLAFSGSVNGASEKVKQAYKNTAKSIGSDTYYGKAMKAIN